MTSFKFGPHLNALFNYLKDIPQISFYRAISWFYDAVTLFYTVPKRKKNGTSVHTVHKMLTSVGIVLCWSLPCDVSDFKLNMGIQVLIKDG